MTDPGTTFSDFVWQQSVLSKHGVSPKRWTVLD